MTPEVIARLPYRPCVGIVLANGRGEVFAGQRIDAEFDAWQMPQGGIDPGESAHNAALRELEEETGVTPDLVTVEAETPDWVRYDLPVELVPKVWKGRFRGQKQRWFLMRFHGTDEQIVIETAHPEFSEWRWIPADEVVDKIIPFKRAVYAEVMGQFAEHLM